MTSRLKRGRQSGDKVDIQRALSSLDGAVRSATSTIDGFQSFDYEVVTIIGDGGVMTESVTGTEAVVSATNDTDFSWGIGGGTLTVTGLTNGATIRFLVF